MKTQGILFLILLFITAFPLTSAIAGSLSGDRPKPPVIAMITWRGETDAEKGFVDGMTPFQPPVTILKYHANQDLQRLQRIIIQIRRQPVDLIYVFGTIATQSVLKEIHDIPLVFNIVNRPVVAGIIQSWNRSGNNATGASNQVPVESQLKALKKVIKFRRLGIIYNPREPNSRIQRNIAKGLQERMDFSLEDYKIAYPSDMAAVMPQLKGNVDAVFIPADSLMITLGDDLARWINDFNLPSLATVETMVVEHGMLLGLQPSYYQLGLMAAEKAQGILDGKSPSDIPSSRLDFFQMTVNMKTASKIDVQIPMSILVMANKIIR